MYFARQAVALAAAFTAGSAALAQLPPRSVGIESVKFSRAGDIVELRSNFILELDNTLVEAVDGGLELGFTAETRLVEERPFWVDRDRRHFVWTAGLSKDQNTGGYQYRAFGTKDWRTVESLAEALGKLSLLWAEFADAEVVGFLCSDKGLVLNRVEIDLKSLPDPLQISLLTSIGWEFSSGWQTTRRALSNC